MTSQSIRKHSFLRQALSIYSIISLTAKSAKNRKTFHKKVATLNEGADASDLCHLSEADAAAQK